MKKISVCIAAILLLALCAFVCGAVEIDPSIDYPCDMQTIAAHVEALDAFVEHADDAQAQTVLHRAVEATESGDVLQLDITHTQADGKSGPTLFSASIQSGDVDLTVEMRFYGLGDVTVSYDVQASPLHAQATQQLTRSRYMPGGELFLNWRGATVFDAFCQEMFHAAVLQWSEMTQAAVGYPFYQLGFTGLCPDHEFVIDAHRDASCTLNGYDRSRCEKCGLYDYVIIPIAAHEMETAVTPATAEADGEIWRHCKNCDYGNKEGLPRIKTVKQLGKECAYTGKPVTILFSVVRTDGRKLYEGEDYTVRYQNNTEVGTATATVVFKGLYAGSRSFTYRILPAKTTVVKQKDASASSVTIAWRKVKGAQSYKVYCYDRAQKAYVPVLETAKNKAKVKKLESGTTYSLRVYAVRKGVQGASSSVLKAATAPTAPQVKLKALKGGVLRVSWTRPKGSSGYLLLIGADPTMEEAVVAEIPDKKTNRLDLPGLPRGETYYVQVLAYRAVNDDAVLSKPGKPAKLRLA